MSDRFDNTITQTTLISEHQGAFLPANVGNSISGAFLWVKYGAGRNLSFRDLLFPFPPLVGWEETYKLNERKNQLFCCQVEHPLKLSHFQSCPPQNEANRLCFKIPFLVFFSFYRLSILTFRDKRIFSLSPTMCILYIHL